MMSRRMGSLCARFSGAGCALLRCRAYTAWKVLLRGQTDEVETETGPLLLLERAARLRDKVCKKKPALQDQWDEAGVESVDLVVRGMSGEIVLEECAAESQTPIKQLVQKIRALMDMEVELVQLCSGTTVLKHNGFLGDYLAPSQDQRAMELTFLKLHGPALTVEAMSGREIKLLDLPKKGDRCHFDRSYRFLSLGSFDEKPSMRYIMTSNDDKATSADETMWRLNVRMPVIVYLNFRSEFHVRYAQSWIDQDNWERNSTLESTQSTGIPNGPYSGPVFQKAVDSGILDLYGSECGEGTYFVFVDVQPS